MSNLYEILEICLQEIEDGSDVDTVLFRYPQHADELRPILQASVNAKSIAVTAPSSDVVRRNRAKVLQQAAEMREAKARPSRRFWTVPLRRVLVTLFVVTALFVSSTNLVRAASTTLPGDHLYPVKRTWEDVLVLFTFNQQVRETLEKAHENERLEELYEVFAEGRSVEVDFAGLVTRQNGDLWLVSGVPVATSAQTVLPAQSIAIGDAVHIVGVTQKDGAVLAKKIELLPAGMPLPEYEHDEASEHEGSDGSKQGSDDNSGKGSESEEESPKNEATQTPDSESGSDSSSEYEMEEESFSGVIESVNGNILVINGQIANISSAEIKGTVRAGLSVKVEGYYDANGLFIVTKIEFKSSSSIDGGSGSSDDDGSDDDGGSGSSDDNGSNDNGDDENDNDNDGGDADNENSGESSDD